MTNNEIIFETVRNTFTPAQLAELVQATYTAEQIAARRAAVTITVDEGSDESAENIFSAMLAAARERFDWILLDAPAGIGAGFRLATGSADQAIVVAGSAPASLRDAARATDVLLQQRSIPARLVVNRVSPRMFSRMELTVDDIMDNVGLPLLGLVPEDPKVVLAAAQGVALIFAAEDGAAEACLRISRRLRGDYVPLMKL